MKQRLLLYALIAAVLFGLYSQVRLRIERNARGRAEGQAAVAVAKLLGGVAGKRKSEAAIVRTLSPVQKDFVKAIKKASPKAKVDSALTVAVTITDTPTGRIVETPGAPKEWQDDYHRFRLEFPEKPDGPYIFHRQQSFRLPGVFVRTPDGKTRVAKLELFELDPITKEVIPITGAELQAEAEFTFADELPDKPPIFKIRALAAVDHRLAFGAGVELLNFERTEKPVLEKVTVSVLGFWDRKTNEGRGVALVGYRILNTNFVVGPYVGISTTGATVFGAGAALQVTR